MSTKKKQAVVWFRFKFEDTAAGRMQIQRAADKLFRLACVSERRRYTEEEVVRMVKAALEKAAWDAAYQDTYQDDPLDGEEFAE